MNKSIINEINRSKKKEKKKKERDKLAVFQSLPIIFGSRYSRMDQVNFVEDSL